MKTVTWVRHAPIALSPSVLSVALETIPEAFGRSSRPPTWFGGIRPRGRRIHRIPASTPLQNIPAKYQVRTIVEAMNERIVGLIVSPK